jgi:hypothetical protein
MKGVILTEYEKAKYEVSQLGAKFLTEDEMMVILKGRYNLYIPFDCEHCGEAQGRHDFTDILYFEAKSKQLFRWTQAHGCGLSSSIMDYGMIARCKFCGHQAVLERLSKF